MDYDRDFSVSLTKGCFVHKPTGKKKKSGSKTPNETLHYKQYKNLWKRMEVQIQNIEKNAYKETFDALVKFATECYSSKPVEIQEIPAAILVMGVNMPDHCNIFNLLEDQLHLNGISGTVILKSKDCNSFYNLLQKLVSGLITKYQMEKGSEMVSLKKLDYTFSKLLSYYESIFESKVTTPKKATNRKKRKSYVDELKSKPMVILIQDVEAFNPEILQELVLNCNLYANKLPIVLVFGMASAMVTLHNILPQKALCCLGIETFYSMTAIEYLTKIIEQVVISPHHPFKLGPRVFKLIVDTVLYHDFSITNLTLLLKFCMLEHFCNNHITAVCCDQLEIKKTLQKLASDKLEEFKDLPSFMKYIENNPDFSTSMKNEKDFRVVLAQNLENLHSYHQSMVVLLNCLHSLTKDLPGYPLGKQLREIYVMALEKDITSYSNYLQAEKFLRMHSKDELQEKLQICLQVLNEAEITATDPLLTEVKETLQNFVEKLKNLKDADYEKETLSDDFDTGKITSRSQLQEKIRSRLKAKRSKFEIFRENIIEYLTVIFKNICPPTKLPLHEVMFFDNVYAVKRHLMPAPRITSHKALVNPQNYLRCHCCKATDSREISSTMPDISIMYKLHLECGKLINLYDWLEAFKSVKRSDGVRNRREKNDEHDSELNMRFMQTVSELQLLGFIKPTKRKTDHVARLTFGSI